ncbi:hypothetical protein [Microbacterium azadirachtae]|uniref:Lipoprotein n=1 Tax=Microbacterium azadirachtae TaxID=582680 RepID=A0A0F0LQ35_9MICO|nr:hypothetical protein [Microbacterium azadirachtae]KJL34380.1 hypothetical protein RS86_00866 [Microbacterium azadirachtae]
MIRKLAPATVTLVAALALAGCSAPASAPTATEGKPVATQEQAKPKEQPKPADLSGDWVQENAGDSFMAATITADAISINWVSMKDDTTAIYWVGTYQAPTAPGDFTWTSTRNEEATNNALLTSTDPTKDFSVAGDKVSYEVTMMGVTKTVSLVRK